MNNIDMISTDEDKKRRRMNIDISSIKDILTDLTFLIEAETGTSVDKAKERNDVVSSNEPKSQLGDRNLIIIKNSYPLLTKYSDGIPVSIFKVPKSLSESKPKAYVPQLLGLGPYNHFRPELQQMQTFKLAEVMKIRTSIPGDLNFDLLVRALRHVGLLSRARACYASYLDMDDESLAFVLAVDGLFLFELLRRCIVKGYDDQARGGFFRDFVNFAEEGNGCPRVISAQDAIMMENQIPIHALKTIVAAEYWQMISADRSSVSIVTQLLPKVLLGFATALSPLKVLKDYPSYEALRHPHLLDLLYSLVTLKTPPEISTRPEEEEEKEEGFVYEVVGKVSQFLREENPYKMTVYGAAPVSEKTARPEEILGAIGRVFMDVLLPQELGKPVKLIQVLIGLPWSIIVSYIKSSLTGQSAEEILIPRASELCRKGIKFCPVDRISEIKFDQSARLFHLPLMELGDNSEVVLRNLVAYEAVAKSEGDSLVLARYMELMSALTKSGKDVKSLDGTIIKRSSSSSSSSAKEDEAIVELFGGMSKAIRRTNTPDLDKVIADVKGYYNGLWSVSVSKFFKKWGGIALCCFVVLAVLLVCLAVLALALSLVYEWLISKKTTQAKIQGGLRGLNLRSYL